MIWKESPLSNLASEVLNWPRNELYHKKRAFLGNIFCSEDSLGCSSRLKQCENTKSLSWHEVKDQSVGTTGNKI